MTLTTIDAAPWVWKAPMSTEPPRAKAGAGPWSGRRSRRPLADRRAARERGHGHGRPAVVEQRHSMGSTPTTLLLPEELTR